MIIVFVEIWMFVNLKLGIGIVVNIENCVFKKVEVRVEVN